MDKKQIIQEVIKLYTGEREKYDQIAFFLEQELLPALFPEAQKYSARSKTPESMAGKILKKYLKKDATPEEIFSKFTDLVGGRVIFLRRDQVDEAADKIQLFFTVDDRNSQNTAERLNDREFGYQSRHFIVRIDSELLEKAKKELSIRSEVLSKKAIQKPVFVELQIRTWLQHVWADLSHDSIYKGDRVIPRELMRTWNAIAAILENVDEDIIRCLDQLEQYRKNSAYNIAEEVDRKIETIKIIAGVQLTHLSKPISKKELYHLAQSRDELLRLGKIGGMKDKSLVNMIGKIEKKIQTPNTPEKDLTNPRELFFFLREEKQHDQRWLVPLLKMALERCENMIRSSSELPWAFAGKAFFKMLLLDGTAENEECVREIYDSVLRLIDLCNERSVANLDRARRIATPEAKDAIRQLLEIISETKFLQLGKSEGGKAPIADCVKKMLELGIYAHGNSEARPEESPNPPAVIIAGGCKEINGSSELEAFKELFSAALCGKNKIWFYTGTGKMGVCGLPFAGNEVKRFGLDEHPDSKEFTPKYRKHSIWEALMEWERLKTDGYRFDDVAMVGFGLGKISQLECKIGLAFGARVTVIGHKNYLSYEQTFEGTPYWSKHPSLVRLPLVRRNEPANRSFDDNKKSCCIKWQDNGFPEPMMLRVFMLFDPYHEPGNNKIDDLVYLIHQIKQIRSFTNMKNLEKNYKGFSAQHRYHSFTELYKDIPGKQSLEELAEQISDRLKKIKFPSSTDRQDLKKWLDELHNAAASIVQVNYDFGEREHARWYIERWLQGTRYGDNRIDQQVPKDQIKNPCMVAWFDLDDDTIEKDTDYIIRYLVANYICGSQKKAKNAIGKLFEN